VLNMCLTPEREKSCGLPTGTESAQGKLSHYCSLSGEYLKLVGPLKVECQHFLDCVKTGARSESSGVEGLEVVRILEAASESLKNNGANVEIVSLPG